MLRCSLLLIAVLAHDQAAAKAPRDPRKQPLTIEDALFRIPNVTGRVILVGDCDGDGKGDLMLARGGRYYEPQRIDLVSSKDGTLIRTVWKRPPGEPFPTSWDAGGDVDGDHVPDLVLGFPDDGGFGRVLVASGKTGETKFDLKGSAPNERVGASVAFVGDSSMAMGTT